MLYNQTLRVDLYQFEVSYRIQQKQQQLKFEQLQPQNESLVVRFHF